MRKVCSAVAVFVLWSAQVLLGQPGPPTLPDFQRLSSWRFDDTNWLTVQGYAPRAFTNILATPSWSLNALTVDSLYPAFLQYDVVETNGHTNLSLQTGTLSFWFQPNWSSASTNGTGPGAWAPLLEAGRWSSNAEFGCWSICLDPGGTNLYFETQTNGLGAVNLQTEINWLSNDWHQIVLTYSDNNSALYIDGALATNGPGVLFWPGADECALDGFFIGSDSTGLLQARGQFENMRACNYVWSEAEIQASYAISVLKIDAFLAGAIAGRWESSENAEPANSEATGGLRLEVALYSDPTTPTLILRGTEAGKFYDLFSRGTFDLGSNWRVEQTITGQAGSTPVLISNTGATMFYAAGESAADSDGDGLPDAYERYITLTEPAAPDTGNTGVSDGYKDPDGDGYTNIEERQNGTHPRQFQTPSGPQSLTVTFTSPTSATLTWLSCRGAVEDYEIERNTGNGFVPVATTPASQTFYVDSLDPATGVEYRVRALYSGNGTHSAWSPVWSEPIVVGKRVLYKPLTKVVRGPEGRLYLVIQDIPEGVVGFKVTVEGDDKCYPLDYFYLQPSHLVGESFSTFELPRASFTNGVSVFPKEVFSEWAWNVFTIEPMFSDGTLGVAVGWPEGGIQGFGSSISFKDGMAQLKQNLAFLLRASFEKDYNFGITVEGWVADWDDYYVCDVYYSTEFMHADFWTVYGGVYGPGLNEFKPFEDNYFYKNVIYDSSQLSEYGDLTTGIFVPEYAEAIAITNRAKYVFPTYDYVISSNGCPILPQLCSSNYQWVYNWWCDYLPDEPYGVRWDQPNAMVHMVGGAKNTFGLSYLSVQCQSSWPTPLPFRELRPGQSLSLVDADYNAILFPEAEEPVLKTIEYYFARPWKDPMPCLYHPRDWNNWTWYTQLFAVTNKTGLLIGSVGESLIVAGYAKQAILNGYSNKFAYLGQYFDKAFKADAEGNVTTNETGILSEYGEFLPLEPGLTYLATKPDPDQTTNAVGYCPVHVIRLSLDVNHDGTMDQSFTGPDNTCAERPFVFWVNNDYDRGHEVDCGPVIGGNCDWEEDDLKPGDEGFPLNSVPDFLYTDPAIDRRAIPCRRDLEDYARIHLFGFSELITNLPQGYSMELHWRDPSTAPGINIFRATDPDGGTGYLTDTNAAQIQTGTNGFYVGSVSSFQTIDLIQKYAETASDPNRRLNDCYIFCGSATGSGELVWQVKDQNSNVVGETSVFIELKDVEDIYERWTCGEVFSSGSGFPIAPMPTWMSENQLAPPQTDEEKDYILLVHGWNMASWEKERFAETAFKRLYWQGYKGRFGLFKWPTFYQSGSLFCDVAFDAANFDRSEFNAWRSATPLNSLLNYLQVRHPNRVRVLAHSMGNVVTGEALRLAGSSTLVHTYVASQAAIPAHCYDPNPAFNMTFESSFDNHTPNAYAQYWTPASPQYFFGIGGTATFVNYFNTNDWALSPLLWELNQKFKPDDSTANYCYNVTSNQFFRGTTALGFPTNTYEIFAFADESRSHALGRQPNVGGAFTVAAQIDLNAAGFDFGTPHKGHSAQFRSYNALRAPYWLQLLRSYRLKED